MKKILIWLTVITVLLFCFGMRCSAAEELFDSEIRQIEDSIGQESKEDLDQLGISGVDDVIKDGVDEKKIWDYLLELIASNSAGPLSALMTLTAVLLLAGIAESYHYSLRYTQTKDVMGVVIGLFTMSVVISPITELVSSAVTVIKGASSVMTVYLPVMAGIMMFSGSAIASAGYYTASVTAAQLLSRLASTVLTPLLNTVLCLSVSAGVCSHVSLSGVTDMLSKAFKYGVTFAVSIFVAVLGLNGALCASADSVANRAAKFGLSSFIPLIGSSISEAYGAMQNSISVLRSGIGVFVILAVFVTFVPLLIRSILWSVTLSLAKTASEVLSVSSAVSVLYSLTQFISALRTVLIAVMTVFIISSSIMIRIGGQV